MKNLSETIQQIKKHGPQNAKIIPNENGKYKIVISTPQGQVTIANNLNRNIAEDIIRQATNRVILG